MIRFAQEEPAIRMPRLTNLEQVRHYWDAIHKATISHGVRMSSMADLFVQEGIPVLAFWDKKQIYVGDSRILALTNEHMNELLSFKSDDDVGALHRSVLYRLTGDTFSDDTDAATMQQHLAKWIQETS